MAIMGNDSGPKSAYELAMERLRKKDEDAGIERQVVTAEQKAAIAEIRNVYQAKLAELEVSVQDKLLAMFDPSEREVLEQQYHRDRERLTAERDAKVAKARASRP
jgi:hypothetical protein